MTFGVCNYMLYFFVASFINPFWLVISVVYVNNLVATGSWVSDNILIVCV